MNKTTIFFAVLLASLLAGCEVSNLGLKIAEVALEKRMGLDSRDNLQDGLHVALCGAGSPMPDPERTGPCVAVMAGDTLVVVDAGSGSSRTLTNMAIPQGDIDAQLLTHFHSDHIDGLGELAMQRWVTAANTSPLPVIGPIGTRNIVAGFNLAYRADGLYRNAHHTDMVAPLSGAGMTANEFKVPEDGKMLTVYEKDGLTVKAFRVSHHPVEPAVGYRFDYKGRSAVISGDTSKSVNVEMAAKGADLLLHEALSKELVGLMEKTARKKNLPIIAKIAYDITDYHTTPVEAAETASAANVGHLMYYHVVPALPAPGMASTFLKGTADTFSGPITLGVDGSMISLPANSDDIIESNLL